MKVTQVICRMRNEAELKRKAGRVCGGNYAVQANVGVAEPHCGPVSGSLGAAKGSLPPNSKL
jgi:hypothetical protein